MAKIEYYGTLISKGNPETFTTKDGREYRKMQFVVEDIYKNEQGQEFVHRLAVTATDKQVDEVKKCLISSKMKLTAYANSREYKGKWYTDITLGTFENYTKDASVYNPEKQRTASVAKPSPAPQAPVEDNPEEDLPF